MAKQQGLVGGFAASNTGKIENCYCVTNFNGKKYTSGGFVGNNKGSIATSFCEYAASGLSGGFSGTRTQLDHSCFFVHDLDAESRKIAPLWDCRHALRSQRIKNAGDASRFGYDMKNIWSYTGQKPLLKFREDNWLYPNSFRAHASDRIISIKDTKNLFLFAEMVNNGDPRFTNANVRLDADINLKGKEWTPIGIDRDCAFTGVFDGNGYTVCNFVIKDSHLMRKGFFGYLKGSVFNLTLDCQIKGDGYIGAIAAENEGTIGCCGATVSMYGKGSEVSAGGLVGLNTGHIFQSYAAGKIKFLMIPIIPIAVLASSAVIISAAALSDFSGSGSVYKPPEKDPNQVQDNTPPSEKDPTTTPDPDSSEEPGGTVGSDTYDGPLSHSVAFTLNKMILVYPDSRECVLDFANPSTNTNSIVIELLLENEDGTRTVIAKSGAVLPGYRLEALTLGEGITFDRDSYAGLISLVPYNMETNDKTMVETELPVDLVIVE